MYLGEITDNESPVSVLYYYTKRGMKQNIFPTRPEESEQCENYGTDGQLFSGFVGFDGTVIGDSGVDIHFVFDKECYVDNIYFRIRALSQIKDIKVFAVENNSYKAIGEYRAKTGGNLCCETSKIVMLSDGTLAADKPEASSPIQVDVGYSGTHFVLRLNADYAHIIVGGFKIFGGTELCDAVYPEPKSIKLGCEYLGNVTGLYAENEDAIAGALYFAEGYETFGAVAMNNEGNVRFIVKEMSDEAFEVEVNSEGATVCSASKRGFVYGAAKLLQLCSEKGIRFASVKDEPYMEIRGFHVALPDKSEFEFLKRLIKYAVVPLGYNTIILQISALMEYKRHPKINEAWVEACENFEKGLWPRPAHYGFLGKIPYSQDEMRDFCAYIRSFGLEIVAEVQTFGHVQYVTMAYPETAEPEYVDEKIGDAYGADERPDEFYHHCMCPNHEDYYKIFYDIIDEVCDVVQPEKYIHIGHDEIYTYGKCEKCKAFPVEKLLADEITKMHDYIATKGLKTMMWSDMIMKEVYSIPEAIDLVPKDIMCLPFTWYFHFDENTENIISDKGFDFVIGNFYSSHYPRFNERKYIKGIHGAEVSAWVKCSEDSYCYEGKMFELVYAANMMWNEVYHENLRKTYTGIVTEYSKSMMQKIRGDALDLSDAKKLLIEKCGRDVPFDISYEIDGAVKVNAGESKEIAVDIRSEKLYFVQATDKNGGRMPWQEMKPMGEYEIIYKDGEKVTAPIIFGRDIGEYCLAYGRPLESPLFRHEGYTSTCYSQPIMGKTCDGLDYTLYARPWKNAEADKKIEKIKIRHFGDTDAAIMVFDIYAV